VLAFAFEPATGGGAVEVLGALEERQVRFSEAVRETDALRGCHTSDAQGVFVTQVVADRSHGQSITRGRKILISRDFQSSLRTPAALVS
jgi:hypothetical protein